MAYMKKEVVGIIDFSCLSGISVSSQIEINLVKSAEHLIDWAGPIKKVVYDMAHSSPKLYRHSLLKGRSKSFTGLTRGR